MRWTKTVAERFWEKVSKTSDCVSGCAKIIHAKIKIGGRAMPSRIVSPVRDGGALLLWRPI